MASSSEPYTYVLGRAPSESERLNQQHAITIKTLTYTLHPTITPSLPASAKIADVGTGTAIFLVDLAASLPPSTTFVGYDISDAQYPPQDQLPKNVELRTNSVLTPFPAAELGTYDVVCLRFMTTILDGAEWKTALENLLTLLKPGGWLQWVDIDASPVSLRNRVYQSAPGASRACSVEVADAMVQLANRLGKNFDGIKKLKSLCEDAEMMEVGEEFWNTATWERLREEWSRVNLQGSRKILEVLSSMPGSGWDKERSEQVLKGVADETSSGRVYTSTDIWVVTGRKKS